MDHAYRFEEQGEAPIVYVRPINVADLPEEIREQMDGATLMYAVYDASGQRLALVPNRHMAFVLARQNELTPVHVH